MIKSMDKMVNILSLFSLEKTSLSIKEIQQELNIPKSTIFRILNTLEQHQYIHKNEATHQYSLGYQFFRLGSIYQSNLDYRNVALPQMQLLMEETQETVELNILDGIYRVCIEKIDSPLDVRNFVRVGERKAAYLGASGKVMLAHLPEVEMESMLKKIEALDLLDIDHFRKEFEEIKKLGYAITYGERIIGTYAIAAPILGQGGKLVAGLTLAGPIQRLSEERIAFLKAKCLRAASRISKYLGYDE